MGYSYDRRVAAKGSLPKAKYKKLFEKIKAEAIKLMGTDRSKKTDHWFGLAAKKFGLKGYGDVGELAQLAGAHLSVFSPSGPSAGWEKRIDKAAQ